MQYNETPVVFDCKGDQLLGVIHHADDDYAHIGVLIVVGGPQYRVGSHRQFVLLARYLAAHGVPVMRFDVRGMGDSEGEARVFDELNDDIAAAVDRLLASRPELNKVVLWGLCDAASASLFYAYRDDRVKGMVLLNPWVFTEQGAAKTYLKHYYLKRLTSANFWRKIFSLRFDYAQSLASLIGLLQQAGGRPETKNATTVTTVDASLALPVRMRECLKRFAHPILLILSGRDLTADEFRETVKSDPEWRALLADSGVTSFDLPEADHTFSSAAWRDQVAEWTSAWIKQL